MDNANVFRENGAESPQRIVVATGRLADWPSAQAKEVDAAMQIQKAVRGRQARNKTKAPKNRAQVMVSNERGGGRMAA